MFKKQTIWAVVYTAFLLSFTIYVLLDTFIISCVYAEAPIDQEQISTETTETETAYEMKNDDETLLVSDASYSDGNITVEITEYNEYDSTIYVADIQLSSADYLKTALAQGRLWKKCNC